MKLVSPRAWLLVVLSAILQFAIFPIAGPVPEWRASFCWIALVPLILALVAPGRTGKSLTLFPAALLGYACGIVWYAGNCNWIYQTMYLYGGLPKPIALLILILFSLYLALYHALFAALFVLVYRTFSRHKGSFLLLPFLWVAVELVRARVTGFPWDLLGYAQIDNLLITRIAPVAGVMGISFLIASINAALAYLFVTPTRSGKLLPSAATLAFVVAIELLGRVPSSSVPTPQSPVAFMMQENLEVGVVGKQVQPLSPSQELDQFSASSLAARNGLKPGDPNGGFGVGVPRAAVIIWPEAPSHLRSDDPAFGAAMARLATEAQAPLIVGSLGVDFDPTSPRGYYVYDSASLFDPTGSPAGRYDKIHLVPWGEYIPFKRFFGFARKLTEGAGDMDPGHARTVFTIAGHTYGVFVCYESIFGDEVRHFADHGAQVLVQISDDGWYGDTGAPWQHLNMARMRAIENHRWLLRATNTGITTAVDPQGRMAAQAPRHVRAAFAFPFAFQQGTTFYTRHGDWFAWLCTLVAVASLTFSFRARVPYN